MAFWRKPQGSIEGPCARCGKERDLTWMTRLQAYICDGCWRRVLGI